MHLRSFEHPQNVVLTQVLNANLELVSSTSPPSDGPLPGGISAKDLAALELGRSLRHWLELQGAVNALIDSSVAADKSIMVSSSVPETFMINYEYFTTEIAKFDFTLYR